MTDHELLTRIDERVQKLDKCITSHLQHHWAVTICVAGGMLSGIIGLIVAFCRH